MSHLGLIIVDMRTTFGGAVAARLEREIRRSAEGLKRLLNEAFRLGLELTDTPARAARFEVRPHAFGFKPGIDLDRMNQRVDELESEETARQPGR